MIVVCIAVATNEIVESQALLQDIGTSVGSYYLYINYPWINLS